MQPVWLKSPDLHDLEPKNSENRILSQTRRRQDLATHHVWLKIRISMVFYFKILEIQALSQTRRRQDLAKVQHV